MSVLDITTNREQIIRDLTDFAEGLVDENGMLQARSSAQACLLENVLSHNDSLIGRLEFWRGRALYAFAFGLLLGGGVIAVAALDVWQMLDRGLKVVGL